MKKKSFPFFLILVLFCFPAVSYAGSMMVGMKGWYAFWGGWPNKACTQVDDAVDEAIVSALLGAGATTADSDTNSEKETGKGYLAGPMLAYQTDDPSRVGTVMESAHSILAGLDPSDELGFAMACGKLWSVHLNDQNGLKYDQDKSFGAANLRVAFNQVRVLELADYPATGRYVGLDVKAMRTQKADVACKHLTNSRAIFLRLVEKVRTFPTATAAELIAARDYEELEMLVLGHLMGR